MTTTTTKFSQFLTGNNLQTSDITVGLRNGNNTQFTNTGLKDASGNQLITYGLANANGVTFNGTGSIVAPVGTTGQQPVATIGGYRFNSTTGLPEYANGSSWTPFGTGTVETILANLPLSAVTVGTTTTLSIVDPLTVQYGGTGLASISPYMPIVGGTTGTGALQSVANNGVAGYSLTYVSNTAVPIWAPGSSSTQVITQTAHGFSVGQQLYLNGAVYTLAQANSTTAAEVVGTVSNVINANTFALTTVGLVSGLSGLTPGAVYWLSDATPGLATTTIPTTTGNITKPVWIAATATSAYVYQERGKIIPSASFPSFGFNSVTTNTSLVAANGYITNKSGSALTYSTPASPGITDYYVIAPGSDTFGWVIQMNTGQTCQVGSQVTSSGGTITSQNQWDAISIVCYAANKFAAYDIVGNPTVA